MQTRDRSTCFVSLVWMYRGWAAGQRCVPGGVKGYRFVEPIVGWAPQTWPDVYRLLQAIWKINLGLLVFNMLPIYPLDGGQILRSLLWFVLGRARSLMVATIIGFLGVAGFIGIGICLPELQGRAACRRELEMRAVRADIRQLRDPRHLRALWRPVSGDAVLGVRRRASHGAMDSSSFLPGEFIVGYRR